jgi:hypothetical protein
MLLSGQEPAHDIEIRSSNHLVIVRLRRDRSNHTTSTVSTAPGGVRHSRNGAVVYTILDDH